jgi:hypothetical protein
MTGDGAYSQLLRSSNSVSLSSRIRPSNNCKKRKNKTWGKRNKAELVSKTEATTCSSKERSRSPLSCWRLRFSFFLVSQDVWAYFLSHRSILMERAKISPMAEGKHKPNYTTKKLSGNSQWKEKLVQVIISPLGNLLKILCSDFVLRTVYNRISTQKNYPCSLILSACAFYPQGFFSGWRNICFNMG